MAERAPDHEELIREQICASAAAGYLAFPDHTEKWTSGSCHVEKHTGIKLTESCAMWPGASVSGLYFAHPEAILCRRQTRSRPNLDYQPRKGLSLPKSNAGSAYLNSPPNPPSAKRKRQA